MKPYYLNSSDIFKGNGVLQLFWKFIFYIYYYFTFWPYVPSFFPKYKYKSLEIILKNCWQDKNTWENNKLLNKKQNKIIQSDMLWTTFILKCYMLTTYSPLLSYNNNTHRPYVCFFRNNTKITLQHGMTFHKN